ncbi:MAG: hypothetical protein CL840_18430 [Crocinitomicaceae bacterium]|nr:hypothetical protein [Crocinitomicaceae bacterium]|tara:strand:+ start:7960 stop:8991 length:1032 start_codon:yes stop_codon:yes gene_type:complete
MKVTSKMKKHTVNMSVIILISVGITFFIAGLESNIVSIVLNVLYGVIIGTSIAIGSGLISGYFFNQENWMEKPSRMFTRVVWVVATFILIDVILVNSIWYYTTQGANPLELIDHPYGLNVMLIEFIIGMVIYLFILSKKYAKVLEENYIRLASIEKEAEKYRYATLINQINPHFLFNTLNTLNGLIYIDVKRSEEFIHHFASIYRYVLDVQQMDVVEMEKEIAFVQDYIYLNNIRFNNQIKLNIDLTDKQHYLVPMSLQLLIENAIKHNTINEEHALHLDIFEKGSMLFVENNLNPKDYKESSHQLGLDNLKKRYASVSDVEIIIKQNETAFTVGLPLLRNED